MKYSKLRAKESEFIGGALKKQFADFMRALPEKVKAKDEHVSYFNFKAFVERMVADSDRTFATLKSEAEADSSTEAYAKEFAEARAAVGGGAGDYDGGAVDDAADAAAGAADAPLCPIDQVHAWIDGLGPAYANNFLKALIEKRVVLRLPAMMVATLGLASDVIPLPGNPAHDGLEIEFDTPCKPPLHEWADHVFHGCQVSHAMAGFFMAAVSVEPSGLEILHEPPVAAASV